LKCIGIRRQNEKKDERQLVITWAMAYHHKDSRIQVDAKSDGTLDSYKADIVSA
jgi:hypothetical protein